MLKVHEPGALLSQVLVGPMSEHTVLTALLLLQTGTAFVVQLLDIGSAAIFFLSALPIFVAVVANPLFSGSTSEIALSTYALGQAFPLFGGVLLLVPVVEVFVPLTGRIGADAPADNLIATIVSSIGALSLPLVIPFAHRFGARTLRRGVAMLGFTTAVLVAVFAMKVPFDAMHQKQQSLHIATADGAPGFELLANQIVDEFVLSRGGDASAALTSMVMDDYNSEWDSLYPFSAFLKPYKVSLAVDPAYVSPWTVPGKGFSISAVNDVKDVASGTRSLTLQISHPELIWTVVAFDAHVLKWNLDDSPPNEHARHRVKEASFYGKDTWTIDLVLKLEAGNPDGTLIVNFVGMQEKGMWPGKQSVKNEGGFTMQLFEELDSWIEKTSSGTIDTLLLGCVAGVVSV
ncbi:hypothetical protein H0H87_003390 [Tephrocybe sp. NHM501043]|nr:hypothetical protein H0H87_003390 [Tephrocybe sp. NHM501043]